MPAAPRASTRAMAAVLALATALAPVTVLAQPRGAAPGPDGGETALQLPSLGESASDDLGPGAERRLGERIMLEIRRDPAYLDDPVLLEYVRALWGPLLEAARVRGEISPETAGTFAWEAFLVRDRSVNAFALPGGYVGVHLGLIAMTASADELASVLAHELAHVSQRHIARSIDQSARSSLVGLAALILGMLAASRSGNADVANAAIAGGQALMIQGQLNYSREMEREADRIGWGILTGAGFAASGMASMFDRLDGANRLNDSNAFPYLRSHPLTVDRTAEARSRMLAPSATGAPQRAMARPSALTHALLQARARVLMDTSAQALQRLAQPGALGAGAPVERLAAAYSGSLSSSLLGDHAGALSALTDARRQLAALAAADAGAAAVLALLEAQVHLARGDGDAALAALQPLDERARAVKLASAGARLVQHRQGRSSPVGLRVSVEALQTWVSEHPRDATAWATLAAVADAAGLPLRSLRAAAESYAARGDLLGAIDRLRAAQQLARGPQAQDHIEASVIDARLRQLAAARRQQLREARGQREDRADRADRDDRDDRLDRDVRNERRELGTLATPPAGGVEP